MSFGGPPVTTETVEEADELLRSDEKESAVGNHAFEKYLMLVILFAEAFSSCKWAFLYVSRPCFIAFVSMSFICRSLRHGYSSYCIYSLCLYEICDLSSIIILICLFTFFYFTFLDDYIWSCVFKFVA